MLACATAEPQPFVAPSGAETTTGPVPPAAPDLLFVDITTWSGLSGLTAPVGVALTDLDRDGAPDLVVGLERETQLFMNLGDGRFKHTRTLSHADLVGTAPYVLDLDGDGRRDLLLIGERHARVVLAGPLGLSESTAMIELPTLTGIGSIATFGDFRGRGTFDLVVGMIAGAPAGGDTEPDFDCATIGGDGGGRSTEKEELASSMVLEFANGAFADLTAESGVDTHALRTQALATVDLDGDGHLDLLVGSESKELDQIWLNDGQGHFKESSAALGIDRKTSAMGFQAMDVDGDLDLDLFVSDDQAKGGGILYVRGDDGRYREEANARGLGDTESLTTWGFAFEDFDLDGDLDAFLANGLPFYGCSGGAQPKSYYDGTPEGHFTRVTGAPGTALDILAGSRGAAFGDIDGDGDLDVVVANEDGPLHVLRNELGRGHWLKLDLRHPQLDPPVGAIVTITVGERKQRRWVQGTASYGGSSSAEVHFGLGAAEMVDEVLVRWPHGQVQTVTKLHANRTHRIEFKPD